jgi:hypothetical protein
MQVMHWFAQKIGSRFLIQNKRLREGDGCMTAHSPVCPLQRLAVLCNTRVFAGLTRD